MAQKNKEEQALREMAEILKERSIYNGMNMYFYPFRVNKVNEKFFQRHFRRSCNNIVAFYDTTNSGSCNEGMAFTLSGVYYSETIWAPFFINYKKIKDITMLPDSQSKYAGMVIKTTDGNEHRLVSTLFKKQNLKKALLQLKAYILAYEGIDVKPVAAQKERAAADKQELAEELANALNSRVQGQQPTVKQPQAAPKKEEVIPEEEETLLCAKCGTVNPSSAMFCIKCGKRLGQEEEETLLCAKCGTVNPSSAMFCMKCGERLGQEEEETLLCAKCGTVNPSSAMFCMKCGERLEQEEETVFCECGKSNPRAALFCMGCGKNLGMETTVSCLWCGAKNLASNSFCLNCGLELRQNNAPVPENKDTLEALAPEPAAPDLAEKTSNIFNYKESVRQCPKCRLIFRQDKETCPVCGSELECKQ